MWGGGEVGFGWGDVFMLLQYKRPVFPYVIGENYHSIPNEFNFAWDSTQTSLNLENSSWIRNTEPYNLIEGDLEYEYTFIPDKLKQTIDIKAIFAGSIDNIGIETGGKLYQINDSIVFDNIAVSYTHLTLTTICSV